MKITGLVLLFLAVGVWAQSDFPFIEYPSIYIYPFYWVFPIDTGSEDIVEGAPDASDVCNELEVSFPVLAL